MRQQIRTTFRVVYLSVVYHSLLTCSGIFGLWSFASAVQAETPAVTAMYPAGVQAGQTVTSKLQGATGTAPVEIWSDRSDLTLKMGEKPDELIVETSPQTRPGIAWLRWHNAEGASDLRPFVIGTVPEINEADPNDSPAQAQAIATLPVTVNGILNQRGDLDTYAITLKKGETLIASLEGSRMLPTPIDGVLQLVDSSGFILAQNEDTNAFDPQLVWTAPSDGRWLIRVFAFPMTPDTTIQYYGSANSIYRLHLTTGPVISHMTPLVRQAGEFTANGWNLVDAKITIAGESGQLRVLPQTSGVVPYLPFQLEQIPPSAGALVIEESSAASQSVPLHASITGVIDSPGDVDVYKVAGVKGQSIRIRTTSRELGSLLDPLIRIRNAAGQQVTEQDDVGELPDPNFDLSFPADEEYSIEITDRFALGGAQFFYSLSTAPELPRFELTVAANRYTLDRAKPVEIPVTISRLAGHQVPIQFSVEGLPPGVMLEAVESMPEGETAKAITLKLSVATDTPGASMPIRIVGRSTSPDLAAPARAPVDGLKQVTTDHLWLTIPAKVP